MSENPEDNTIKTDPPKEDSEGHDMFWNERKYNLIKLNKKIEKWKRLRAVSFQRLVIATAMCLFSLGIGVYLFTQNEDNMDVVNVKNKEKSKSFKNKDMHILVNEMLKSMSGYLMKLYSGIDNELNSENDELDSDNNEYNNSDVRNKKDEVLYITIALVIMLLIAQKQEESKILKDKNEVYLKCIKSLLRIINVFMDAIAAEDTGKFIEFFSVVDKKNNKVKYYHDRAIEQQYIRKALFTMKLFKNDSLPKEKHSCETKNLSIRKSKLIDIELFNSIKDNNYIDKVLDLVDLLESNKDKLGTLNTKLFEPFKFQSSDLKDLKDLIEVFLIQEKSSESNLDKIMPKKMNLLVKLFEKYNKKDFFQLLELDSESEFETVKKMLKKIVLFNETSQNNLFNYFEIENKTLGLVDFSKDLLKDLGITTTELLKIKRMLKKLISLEKLINSSDKFDTDLPKPIELDTILFENKQSQDLDVYKLIVKNFNLMMVENIKKTSDKKELDKLSKDENENKDIKSEYNNDGNSSIVKNIDDNKCPKLGELVKKIETEIRYKSNMALNDNPVLKDIDLDDLEEKIGAILIGIKKRISEYPNDETKKIEDEISSLRTKVISIKNEAIMEKYFISKVDIFDKIFGQYKNEKRMNAMSTLF
ncbi:23065_t:CDS:2 [Dentiscutata erythropus]|uniref:23065_t:CDS:1 n=1 Tax=Dentiscutata erythropus TaxID=1348616 RepID=A0A9N9HS38_9GLOM|nr:23065_t:CDS:2 [Dentiscutata erythropus]